MNAFKLRLLHQLKFFMLTLVSAMTTVLMLLYNASMLEDVPAREHFCFQNILSDCQNFSFDYKKQKRVRRENFPFRFRLILTTLLAELHKPDVHIVSLVCVGNSLRIDLN